MSEKRIDTKIVFESEQATEAGAKKSYDSEGNRLAKLAGEGNSDAFEELYNKFKQRTYSLCLRMTKNDSEAEEITQQVFIQLFKKIGSFKGESAFTTWLHRMTVNQVLMHYRRSDYKHEKTTEDGEMPDRTVRGSEKPSKMSIDDRIALDAAIEQLPAGYKEVFILHDIKGFEHADIVQILGIHIGTSKSQLARAREKMQKLLSARANPRLGVVELEKIAAIKQARQEAKKESKKKKR